MFRKTNKLSVIDVKTNRRGRQSCPETFMIRLLRHHFALASDVGYLDCRSLQTFQPVGYDLIPVLKEILVI